MCENRCHGDDSRTRSGRCPLGRLECVRNPLRAQALFAHVLARNFTWPESARRGGVGRANYGGGVRHFRTACPQPTRIALAVHRWATRAAALAAGSPASWHERRTPSPDSHGDGRNRPPAVLTVASAIAMIGEPAVRWRLHSGRWQRPCRGVLVTHSGGISDTERLWIAVLGAGSHAVLGGLTAARLDGLTGFDDRATHLCSRPAARFGESARGGGAPVAGTRPGRRAPGPAAAPDEARTLAARRSGVVRVG